MQFLTQHWHCIFPLAGLIVAAFLFRDTSGKKRDTTHADNGFVVDTKEEK